MGNVVSALRIVSERWNARIVMHSKCVEMHSNANFVQPVFPKDGHRKIPKRKNIRSKIFASNIFALRNFPV